MAVIALRASATPTWRWMGPFPSLFGTHKLVRAKARNEAPIDPVAAFLLGLGVILHRADVDAARWAKGRGQSAGLMVNFLYDPGRLTHNEKRFATFGEIALSPQVRTLCAAVQKALQPGKIA